MSKNTHKSFQEFCKGPYTIVEIISSVCYKIQKNSNPTDIDNVYASRLKNKIQNKNTYRKETPWWEQEKMACAKDPFSKVYLKLDG